MDNNRLLISIIVVLGILFLYQELLQWRYPDLYGPKSKLAQKAGKASGTTTLAPFAGPTPMALAPEGNGLTNGRVKQGAITAAPVRTIKVDTNYYEALLTGYGGRLESFRLKKFKQTSQLNSPYYQMIRPGERLPMGVLISSGDKTADDSDVLYTTEAPSAIEATASHPATLTFMGKTSNGFSIQKTFTFTDASYVFSVFAVVNVEDSIKPDGIGLTISQPLTELAGYRDYPMLQSDVNGKALNIGEKQLQKGATALTGSITYAGFGDRYFLSAFLPITLGRGTGAMDYMGSEADAKLLFPAVTSVTSQVYMGPKELQTLESVNPALSKALDVGFWGVIAIPFLRLLKLLYEIVPNYGVAIILLTVLVRLLTLPMSIKGQRSMMKMQRLQPQVERIRERYKNEQEKLHHEMMELYKRNHVNPLGGCLPMVIQFPVFIGLYEALLNAVELRNAPFIGWIRDLAAPDCLPIPGVTVPFTDLHGIPVLVILMALTAFVQQWISPRNPDPSQQKMMMYMPVVFSIIFIELPAGLSLYYFFSNLLGVVQQFILNREFKQYSPVTTT
ncbi:MAG: membrane protein insertase YidC [Deltaproteobacteria bacterium]|nr:membrane protein insertase YidC [Deltaproteobacteria bacterium]